MSVRDKIVEAIHDFGWPGELALPAEPEDRDWVSDLADAICTAIDDQPFHTIELREDGWTLKHPLDCRDDLFGCQYNRASGALDGPPESGPGVYRVSLTDRGLLLIEDEVSGG